MCLIDFDTRIILRPYYSWAWPSYAIYHRVGAQLTCFSPRPLCVDLVGPDGSWEDGAGHRRGVCLQTGVASPGGGALVPEISLDRGVGEVDPRATAWRHQPGREQESQHVGHPTITSSTFTPAGTP